MRNGDANILNFTEDIEIKAFKTIGNKIREFDEKHGWIDYFIAPVLVCIILLVVYAIKGVYPFGLNTVAYYDMTSNGIPGYTYMWDEFHGKASIFINWLIACGASNASGLAAFFNPFNYLFFFTTRDNILFYFSFFLMIKMAFCAFSMSFYFKKHFGDTVGTICAGMLYACSGYIIQYYNNIFFLYFAFCFPFVVYLLEKLIHERKYILFAILMFLVFTQNIQFVFMTCVYLVFKGYLILREMPKEERGASIKLLSVTLVVSALLACVCIIPNVLQLSQSTRVTNEGGFNYLESMKAVYNSFRRQKHLIMYGSEIAVGLFILVLLRGKAIVRKYSDNLIMIFMLGLPILHEGINLLWHAGSYKHFPIRFGYMLTFECLIFVGKYIRDEQPISIKYIGKAAKIICVSSIPFVAYVLFEFYDQFTLFGIGDLDVYGSYWIYFVTLSFVYFISFLMETQGSRKFVLILLALIQASCGCYGLIAPKSGEYKNYRVQYIINAIELEKAMPDNSDMITRIKAEPSMYESDYSMIIGKPAISYWSNGASGNLEEMLQSRMGYDGMNTYVMDSGGTVFTDELLGMKWYAASRNPDEYLYKTVDGNPEIFEFKYSMPIGVVADNTGYNGSDEAFAYNNALFTFLTGIKDELIANKTAQDYIVETKKLDHMGIDAIRKIFEEDIANREKNYITDDEDISNGDDDEESNVSEDDKTLYEYVLRIPVASPRVLYLYASRDIEYTMELLVNGKPVRFDSMMSYPNYIYPCDIRSGIVALGTYEDDTVEIRVYTENEKMNNVHIGLLDLETLSHGIDVLRDNQKLSISINRNRMFVSGKTNKSGTMFLPVAYSQNWSAKLNGAKVPVKSFINDAFVAVEVPEGDVSIEFRYIPKGLIPGIIISVIGLILGIFLIRFERHGGLQDKKCEPIIDKIFMYGFNVVVVVLFIVMYVVPIWIKMSL